MCLRTSSYDWKSTATFFRTTSRWPARRGKSKRQFIVVLVERLAKNWRPLLTTSWTPVKCKLGERFSNRFSAAAVADSDSIPFTRFSPDFRGPRFELTATARLTLDEVHDSIRTHDLQIQATGSLAKRSSFPPPFPTSQTFFIKKKIVYRHKKSSASVIWAFLLSVGCSTELIHARSLLRRNFCSPALRHRRIVYGTGLGATAVFQIRTLESKKIFWSGSTCQSCCAH